MILTNTPIIISISVVDGSAANAALPEMVFGISEIISNSDLVIIRIETN